MLDWAALKQFYFTIFELALGGSRNGIYNKDHS